MENIVFFETVDELIEKMKYLDNNPKIYDKILKNFKDHFYKYHSHEAWSQYLLNCILDK